MPNLADGKEQTGDCNRFNGLFLNSGDDQKLFRFGDASEAFRPCVLDAVLNCCVSRVSWNNHFVFVSDGCEKSSQKMICFIVSRFV